MESERRVTGRQIMFRIGEIKSANCPIEINCLVRDTSATGALIEVRETDGIPEHFELEVPSVRLLKSCRVVRRTKHMLGVAFAE